MAAQALGVQAGVVQFKGDWGFFAMSYIFQGGTTRLEFAGCVKPTRMTSSILGLMPSGEIPPRGSPPMSRLSSWLPKRGLSAQSGEAWHGWLLFSH